ncbi:hypothetical protein [Chenggangzhangella methanolivorans]|uniref:Uncharacterized protein n=1 Tax=Chenggangzhangella methanolivorans TaxID=1437009 RepID=A0A9E6R8I5_9HYPH|nr:hypothetical protein [Chenggangzhangella methanolivorans]QZO00014.1 hypothetical protein K6K41_26080 [Chenggangzhangella methanolivorans]
MKILAGALALCFVTCAADVAVADTYKYVFTKSSKAKDFKTIRTKWVVRARAYRPLSSPTGYSATLLRNKKFSNVSVATMIVSDPYHYEGGPILRVKRSGDAISGYGGLVLGNNGIFSVYINRYDRYSLDTIGGRLTNLCFAYFTATRPGRSSSSPRRSR